MNHRTIRALTPLFLILIGTAAVASVRADDRLAVLVDGEPRREYRKGNAVYIEAIRGREYALRLTNPTSDRVAVALSVDGLNTIDARHTDPWSAAKWIIDPWDSIVISGWQVSDRSARQFFFTGERSSSGAALGQTEDLGVIEAVWFRERQRRIVSHLDGRATDSTGESRGAAARESGSHQKERSSPAPAAEAMQSHDSADDYAATGIGSRVGHRVQRVHFDLDPSPVATARIRYEFRPQLIELGILAHRASPLERRERARGFAGYCPEP